MGRHNGWYWEGGFYQLTLDVSPPRCKKLQELGLKTSYFHILSCVNGGIKPFFIWVPIVQSVEAYLVCDSWGHYKNRENKAIIYDMSLPSKKDTYIHTYSVILYALWSHHVLMCIAASREKQLKYFRRLDQKPKPCHFESSKRLPRLTPAEAQDAEVLTSASHFKATMAMIVS